MKNDSLLHNVNLGCGYTNDCGVSLRGRQKTQTIKGGLSYRHTT